MSKPVTLVVAGAGSRGTGYARFALEHPDRAKVVGVAEPREFYRERLAKDHDIPRESVFADWKELAAREKFADAAIVATQDAMHVGPAVEFARKGYHLLLEKPMAPSEEGCRRIVDAAMKNEVILAVCHVLRYTAYTRRLKKIIDSGAIGEVVSVQHLEPVGYWHMAHAFVRGNWRNEQESSFMLLSKSCHDLDWLRHIVGARCLKVSSFGSLKHFRKEEKPAEAGDAARCLDCPHEPECPYSAKRIYLGRVERGHTGWPVDVLTPEVTVESVTKALRDGPYGRCVYGCDNDVVDHQVVNMLFEGGKTAAFTMVGLTEMGGRKTRVFGTKGELYGDGTVIEHYDFLTEKKERIDTRATDASVLGGHGGGDYGLMDGFIAAVAEKDPTRILSGPEETLETHLMVFAAERSRREGRVVELGRKGRKTPPPPRPPRKSP